MEPAAKAHSALFTRRVSAVRTASTAGPSATSTACPLPSSASSSRHLGLHTRRGLHEHSQFVQRCKIARNLIKSYRSRCLYDFRGVHDIVLLRCMHLHTHSSPAAAASTMCVANCITSWASGASFCSIAAFCDTRSQSDGRGRRGYGYDDRAMWYC